MINPRTFGISKGMGVLFCKAKGNGRILLESILTICLIRHIIKVKRREYTNV